MAMPDAKGCPLVDRDQSVASPVASGSTAHPVYPKVVAFIAYQSYAALLSCSALRPFASLRQSAT